jgi:LysM repeat protein
VHMPPTMDSNQAREHGQVYVVKITDSYKKIAHAHNISVAQLKAANHIKGDTLHTGQKLVIPSAGTLAAAPATTTTSTHLDATPVQPMLANSVSSTITPSASHHHTYTVVKGDTLVRIAHKFKTTPAALMEANDITDPTKLAIGKKLKIPSQESRSARINTPPQMEKPTTIMPTAVQPPVAQPTAVQPMEPQPSQVESAPQQTQDDASGHLANFVP